MALSTRTLRLGWSIGRTLRLSTSCSRRRLVALRQSIVERLADLFRLPGSRLQLLLTRLGRLNELFDQLGAASGVARERDVLLEVLVDELLAEIVEVLA